MAPSKLSPAERAFRKRELARLRQRRCRERKRQAALKRNMRKDNHNTELPKGAESQSQASHQGHTSPVIIESHEGEKNHAIETPCQQLVQTHQVSIQSSYSRSMSLSSVDQCGSPSTNFGLPRSPSSISGPSTALTDAANKSGLKAASLNSVMADFCRQNTSPLVNERSFSSIFRRLPQSVDGNIEARQNPPLYQTTKESSIHHDVELEAVQAMLSLNKNHTRSNIHTSPQDIPFLPLLHNMPSNYAYDQGFEQGYIRAFQQSAYLMSMSSHRFGVRQYDIKFARPGALMQEARDYLRPEELNFSYQEN